MNSQFHKGVIEMCVLALVAKRDFYGYELVETISKKIEISEGTIYPILRRLTQEKYFETYLKESSEGPPRKYYRMTADGRRETEKLLKEWKKFTADVDFLTQYGEKSEEAAVFRNLEKRDLAIARGGARRNPPRSG